MISTFTFSRGHRFLPACCLLWLLCCASWVVKAQTPNPNAWITDGYVNAIASDASYTYIGGSYSYIGPNTGSGVQLTTASSAYNASFAQVSGGSVSCAAPDGAGGWYIGGSFTNVGGYDRSGLAHILSSGATDATWDPSPDGNILSIAVSGTDIYVGGPFLNIGGQAIAYLAKLNNTTGAANTSWTPNSNDQVQTITVYGTDVYVGGDFTSMGGQTRNYIAKLNNTDGSADASWDANADNGVFVIVTDGSDVYAGGNFTSIGGQTRTDLAKLDISTGAAETGWDASTDGDVHCLAIDGPWLYVGGNFNTIGGISMNYAARVDLSNASIDTWAPNLDDQVSGIAIIGSYAYLAGAFNNVNNVAISDIAKVDLVNGDPDITWGGIVSSSASCIAVSGTDIYVGGNFTSTGGLKRSNIARISNTTGAGDAAWDPGADAGVNAIEVSGTDVYVGGGFFVVGGQSRSHIAKLDNTTGAADGTWDANANNDVYNIKISGSDIYAGGTFTNIGGATRQRIAKLNNTNGDADGAWVANANAIVYSIAISGPYIYAGGNFSTIGGQTRHRIAKLTNTNGSVDASWNPNADASVYSIAVSGSDVYAAGAFGAIGTQTMTGVAKLNNTNGNADASWNANLDGQANVVTVIGLDVYIGGFFNTAGGQTRSNLAKLNNTNGDADAAWDAKLNSPATYLVAQGSYLCAGGGFTLANGQSQPYFALFYVPPPYTWTGATSNDWNTAANWDLNAVPASTDAVAIPSGTTNAPDLNNANFTVSDFTQASGQTLTLGTGNITVTGKCDNNGTITSGGGAGAGKLVLNGTAAQNITGSGTVENIELNNSNGATIGATSADTLKVKGLITLTSGTLTTNGKLILKSTDVTATAMVGPVPASGAGISGTVVHERYLSAPANTSGGRSWRLLTSPLHNTTDTSIFYHWQNNGVNDSTGLELFNPSGTGAAGNGLTQGGLTASIRSFDYLTNAYVAVTNTKTTALFNGTHNNTFFVFASGYYGSGNITSGSAITNIDATGTLITGTQNYSFTPPNAANIYYLMGNPYACPIDFDKVYLNTGTTNINRKFWVIDPNLSSVGAYATVTYTGGIYVTSAGTQNQYIQTGQGFFVEGSSGVAATVGIEEDDKETNAAQTAVMRTNGGSLETFRMKLYKTINSTATLLDGAVVAAHQTSNNAIDGVDAVKFNNFNENIGILNAGKVLAIDARQLLDNQDTVKLSLSSMQQTVYQLVFEPGNMAASGLAATLIDNFTNTTVPVSLAGNTTYSFTVTSNAASTGTNRFKVAFNTITPLAIVFVNTNATRQGDKADVQWTVANQDDIHYYELERSADAKTFSKIATVQAGTDNLYSYADETPVEGNNYYRVKAVARSSNGVYSNIVRVNMDGAKAELSTYPNPVKDGHLQVSVSNLAKGNYTINIYTTTGQIAATKQLAYEGGSTVLEMDITALASGMYLMHLTNDNGETIAEQKIVKQ